MKLADRNTFLEAFLKAALSLGIVWTCAELLDAEGLLRNEISVNLGIYAISRSLNAAISVVQSAEVSLIVANVDMGELLDPVNDAVERFSTVLTWATASLLVQKFVITLIGSTAYKMIATIAVVIYLLAVALGAISGRIALMAKAAFEFLGWITLAVVLAIWFSISMTSEWLGGSIQTAERDLQAFKLEATQLQGLITGRFDADVETTTALEDQRASLSDSVEEAQARLATIEAEIVTLQSQVEAARPELSLMDRLRNPFGGEDSPELLALHAALETAQEQRQTIHVEIETLNADLACLDEQIAGGVCEGLMGRLSAFAEGVTALAGRSPELIVSLLDVMAAVVFKNLLAPLMLAYVILKFGPSWITRRAKLVTPTPSSAILRSSAPQISKEG